MNIFNKVTLQSMKISKTRTIVTIIGVVLSVAMITGVITFGVSLLDYVTRGAVIKYGDWHVNFPNVESSFIEEQSENEKVQYAVTFKNIGYAELKGSKNPDKPYLFIAGFNEETFEKLPINLLSGRFPKNEKEVIVSSSIAANGGVQFEIGDTLSLNLGSRMKGEDSLSQNEAYSEADETLVIKEEREYTVVGVCQRPTFEPYCAPGYTLITKATSTDDAQRFNLFVTLKKPRGIHTYINQVARKHSYCTNDNVLRFMGLSDDRLFNGLLYSIGSIVILIIMIGSVFLIYNSFNISLNERTHQFGILASVGATAKQLRNSVLFEGVCIGIIGIPIGVIVGIGCIHFVIQIVARNFGSILYTGVDLTLKISVLAILGAIVVSMVTILISAYIPAQKAANTPIMDCIRQTNEVKVQAHDMKTSRFSQYIYGLEATLALKNFKRNKKRYRSIVLSLVLSVVLFISVNAFVIYLKQASERAIVFTTYDISFTTKDMEDNEMIALYDELKTVKGVYESSYQALVPYSCSVNVNDLADSFWKAEGTEAIGETINLPIKVQFIDDSTYENMIKSVGLNPKDYMGQSKNLVAIAKMENTDPGLKEVEQFEDMFIKKTAHCTIKPKLIGSETKNLAEIQTNITLIETVPPDWLITTEPSKPVPYFLHIIAPYSSKEQFEATPDRVEVKGLTFSSKNAAQSVKEMERIIKAQGITSDYKLMNMNQMLDESRNYIFIANVFSYTFIIMISLIAVANVFNTISTNIKLRKRELAMLRSVGMSERDFQKMMNFECAFYGIRALKLGLPVALLNSYIIYKLMAIGGLEEVEFVLPWGSIVISIFGVLAIVFITMLYAVSEIKRENIIDALRDDIT